MSATMQFGEPREKSAYAPNRSWVSNGSRERSGQSFRRRDPQTATADRASATGGNRDGAAGKSKPNDDKVLFQAYFRSVGPRTYAAQIKQAKNGNQYLVMTEGKRDKKTNELKKVRLFVYSEDFVEFFKLLKQTSEFIKANPLPPEFKERRAKFWKRQNEADPEAAAKTPRPAGTAT